MGEFLDLAEIASALGIKRETVRDKVVKRADFPRPAIALSQKIRRWSQSEVQSWLEKQTELNRR